MDNVLSWVNVVTDPLGLAGFALFLVFGVLAKLSRTRGQTWLAISAVSMAAIALIGGLLLSWQRSDIAQQQSTMVPAFSEQPLGEASQTTYGEKSPAVQNIEGNVTINIDSQGNNKD
jgi:hypothetical protein